MVFLFYFLCNEIRFWLIMNIFLERDSYMKGSGMLVGDFEITLKRKKSGWGSSFSWPLKDSKQPTVKHITNSQVDLPRTCDCHTFGENGPTFCWKSSPLHSHAADLGHLHPMTCCTGDLCSIWVFIKELFLLACITQVKVFYFLSYPVFTGSGSPKFSN